MEYSNFYDLKSLVRLNEREGCAYSIEERDVEKVNRLISRMRKDREENPIPVAGDTVTYTTRGGDYYPQAHIERRSDGWQVDFLCHIIQLTFDVRQVAAARLAILRLHILYFIRIGDHLFRSTLVPFLTTNGSAGLLAQRLGSPLNLRFHWIFGWWSAAVAGVLERLFILLQSFAQLAVFFQQSVDITVEGAVFRIQRVNRFSQRLKLCLKTDQRL